MNEPDVAAGTGEPRRDDPSIRDLSGQYGPDMKYRPDGGVIGYVWTDTDSDPYHHNKYAPLRENTTRSNPVSGWCALVPRSIYRLDRVRPFVPR